MKVMSEKGSMTVKTILYFMRYFNTYVRKHVPQEEKILMTLDCHSSRKWIFWHEEAMKNNIEIAKTPANTSHVLQPYDQRVNKVIKSGLRRVRDQLSEAGMKNTKSVKFKLITALAAIDDLSSNYIKVSFSTKGLWPMDMRFLRKFETASDRLKMETQAAAQTRRKPDSATTDECRDILCNSSLTLEEQLRDLSILLKPCDTVNNI